MSPIRALPSLLALLLAGTAQAHSFTYGGQLEDHDRPADGRYALRLTLYAGAGTPGPIAGPLELSEVQVAQGRFAVGIEFPELPEHLDAAWLEVAVKRADDDGEFVPLAGRTRVALKATQVCPASWTLIGNAATNPGVNFLGTTDAQALDLRSNNQRALRLESVPTGTANLIGGSAANTIGAGVRGATIAGGGVSPAEPATPGTGPNHVFGHYGSVGGGAGNTAAENFATTAGGLNNYAGGFFSAVGGGTGHGAYSSYSTVAGGSTNSATGFGAAVGGGALNQANGQNSSISGGSMNCAGGESSWAGGYRAKVRSSDLSCGSSGDSDGDEGSFVWADAQSADFVTTGPNQFNVRASGGVTFNDQTNLFFGDQTRQMLNLFNAAYAIGVQADTLYQRSALDFAWHRGGEHTDTAANAGTGGSRLMLLDRNGVLFAAGFVPSSDRALKSNITEIDVTGVLAQVLALPIRAWNFSDAPAARHIGPMAQDFHAAFGLNGDDDTGINTLDADGVVLAAIQGLNAKLQRENDELRARLDAHADELADLRAQVAALTSRATATP